MVLKETCYISKKEKQMIEKLRSISSLIDEGHSNIGISKVTGVPEWIVSICRKIKDFANR